MSAEPPKPSHTWKLPDGIEDHIEQGLLKLGGGVIVGGLFGLAFLHPSSRSTAVTFGIGVAVGSTYARLVPPIEYPTKLPNFMQIAGNRKS
jgi:Domain of unknown function (DUF543)